MQRKRNQKKRDKWLLKISSDSTTICKMEKKRIMLLIKIMVTELSFYLQNLSLFFYLVNLFLFTKSDIIDK